MRRKLLLLKSILQHPCKVFQKEKYLYKTQVGRGIQFLLILSILGWGCGKRRIFPAVELPGYRAQLIFEDDFRSGLFHWFVDGDGRLGWTLDSTFQLNPGRDTLTTVLWLKQSFGDNVLIEYEIFFPNSFGMHWLYFCQERIEGKPITKNTLPPPEMWNFFIRHQLNGYEVGLHCWNQQGQYIGGGKLRRNPGGILLSGIPFDPCQDNRKYVIDVAKTGNRIRVYVDGILVHDVKDRGGFGPVYSKGQIGFGIRGKENTFYVLLNYVRIFQLKPY